MSFLHQLEFHRRGIGLAPAPGTRESAIHVEADMARPLRSCTCEASNYDTCGHLKELSRQLGDYRKRFPRQDWAELFSATIWYRLARLVFDAGKLPAAQVRVARVETDDGSFIRVTTPKDDEIATYLEDGPARLRLLERLGKTPKDGQYIDRAGLLERLALFQMKPEESEMADHGMKTGRQVWEESFWHRLAYHCVREHVFYDHGEDPKAGAFEPAIDRTTGDFTLTFHVAERPICRVALPRQRVEAVLKLLAKCYPDQPGLAIHPVPIQSLFQVTQTTELDLEVRPMIRALQASGETRFYARKELEKFTYGRLVYVSELGILAQVEEPGKKKRRFKAPMAMKLAKSQVPTFLAEHSEALAEGALVLDEPLRDLKIFTEFDWVEMAPAASPAPATDEQSWYHLSVHYGFGDGSVSLADILESRRRGLPYLETADGWIDLKARIFDTFDDLAGLEPGQPGEGLRLSASQLLFLQAQSSKDVRIGGKKGKNAWLRQVLDMKPRRPFKPLQGMTSELRPYQVLGVDWLRFLFENGLGGLLCDDMGLGKTHQAMALMLGLEEMGIAGPFLVVCPTSVMSHWRNKVRDHAPGLDVAVHHGPERDLEAALENASVVVTSYGIMRNDFEKLSDHTFALTVFDEIQYLKNPGTLSYQAARSLGAGIKIGLTGTPIENNLLELKALFDLVLPGYLGANEAFARRFRAEALGDAFDKRLRELRRMISPFVLRRLKSSVLDELPEKFEDTRTCGLSSDQVKLYREMLKTRGKKLVAELEDGTKKRVPYIHVFALLNILKQICDHPALALHQLDRADHYVSGKWELYLELMQECLDNGQKVVVFTQYLGMIELMKRHLAEIGVEASVLTGASVDRGEIVRRFNEDDDCRVFLGSLKAGGTGIDLVGGSVVIHYDRWWNAAREDQATDRAHRIGQKRAVQVLKLVTEGTLEEKIATIIEKKRDLMESVVEEDDPRLAKIFSREELLELLRHEV